MSTSSPSGNYFAALSVINVNEHVEKKGGFSYLSWPFAVAQLRMAEPTASWEVRRFEGLPYLATEAGVFVEVAVTVQGTCLSQIHPVLDARNRPIPQPTAFDINTSIQRCLVKAIALHGLGLYIYAGEDLPQIGTDPAANDAAPPPQPAAPRAPSQQPVRPSPVRPEPVAGDHSITLVQQRTITRVAAEVGIEMPQLLQYFGVNDLGEIATSDFQRVMRALAKRRSA
ncbi:MAG: DUF1071 domain-containing protein [Betaproteobacteria bacterium]|nr:DUF1071 domain-containing protein [Betaproteobacteria bacterium]